MANYRRGLAGSASVGAILLLGLLACRGDKVTASAEKAAGAPFAQTVAGATADDLIPEPHDLPFLDVDLPDLPPLWETDDAALVDTMRKVNGRAFVAFKNPGAAHLNASRRLEIVKAPLLRWVSIPDRQVYRGTRQSVQAESIRRGLVALAQHGAHIRTYFENLGIALVDVSPDSTPAVRRDSLVDWIEPDGVPGRTHAAGRSLGRSSRSALRRSIRFLHWGQWMIDMISAWSSTTGAGARLLVIDTGLDTAHVDMPRGIPASHCLGGWTGCIDEVPGQHGTGIASIVFALGPSQTMIGIAYGIAPTDVYTWGACHYAPNIPPGDGHDTGEAGDDCPLSDVLAALNWAVVNLGPHAVINMSIGFTGPSAPTGLTSAIGAVENADIVIVASVGNVYSTGSVTQPFTSWPAANYGVIAVSGVSRDSSFTTPTYQEGCNIGTAYAGSNQGSFVTIAAPFWAEHLDPTGDNNEREDCGTSYSAPYVAATAVLLRALHPEYTRLDVASQLMNTATPAHGNTAQIGAGIVQAALALGFTKPITTGSISNGRPKLSWSPVAAAARFHVYRGITPQCPIAALVADVPSSTTSFTDASTHVSSFLGYQVTPNTTPYATYTVVAVSPSGKESSYDHSMVYAVTGWPAC